MSESYEVKITTQGDPKGADKVAESLQKVTKSAAETGKQSQSLSNDLTSLGARNNATKDVVEGLDSALRGNAQSFFGVAKAATNLWEVLTVSTPMGRLVQLGLIAVNTFSLMARHMGETGKKAADATPDVDALAEAMKRAGEARTDITIKGLAAIKAEAKGAADELERVVALKQMILKARGDDSPESQWAIDDMKLGEQYFGAKSTRDQTASARDGLAGEMESLKNAIAARAAAPEQRRALQIELQNLQRQTGGTREEAFGRGERMQEIAGMLKGMPDPNSPEARKFLEVQKERAKKLQADLDKAIADATAAEESFHSISQRVGGFRADGSAIPEQAVGIARGLDRRRRRIAAGEPEPESNIDTSRRAENFDRPSTGIIFDSRTINALAREQGKSTAEIIARLLGDAIGESNAAMLRELEQKIKAQRR